ncbi:PIN domain-containing protein [Candidatus Pacearchaeota archaeon]|nr:PIN domain-containing protein [Candidatus Pacearchaeota archaeon]
MPRNYYFDTSIWLDFFENRNEPKLPKGKLAHALIKNLIQKSNKIVYSDLTLSELEYVGYSLYELDEMFLPLKPFLIFLESTEKQIGKAKDLSAKRNVPKGDALHALIARDSKSILITRDIHFQKMLDIIKPVRPQEII